MPADSAVLATYRRMLEQLTAEQVWIRTESRRLPWGETYRYEPVAEGRPAFIRVVRETGGLDFHLNTEDFIAGIEDVDEECISVAHEFGHRRTMPDNLEAYSKLDDIKDRLTAKPEVVRAEECDALYGEEVSAWDAARELLRGFGLPEDAWPRYEAERKRALGTYEEPCRRVAGWTPERLAAQRAVLDLDEDYLEAVASLRGETATSIAVPGVPMGILIEALADAAAPIHAVSEALRGSVDEEH